MRVREREGTKIVSKSKREREKEIHYMNNIMIKGINLKERITNNWIKRFIRDKLKVEVKVRSCKRNGEVIVAIKVWETGK